MRAVVHEDWRMNADESKRRTGLRSTFSIPSRMLWPIGDITSEEHSFMTHSANHIELALSPVMRTSSMIW